MLPFLLCLAGVSAYIAPTSNFNVSTPLASQTLKLKVMFYDFDETLVVGVTGSTYLGFCGGNCTTYTPTGPCPCNASTNAFGDFFAANYSADTLGPTGFNGSDRRDRLVQEFQHLQANGVTLQVVSTSWYSINAAAWAYFLNTFFTLANISAYLNTSNIITLDDPGAGIAANKSAKMLQYLAQNSLTLHQSLFADDSPSNIAIANGSVDWLQVIPRAGLALDAMTYIEARSDQFSVAPTPAPTTKNGQTTAAASMCGLVLALFLSS